MTKFTIVAIDYENHVDRNRMREGIDSLKQQTFKDFELLVIHDGPKSIPYQEEINTWPNNTKFLNTDKYYGVYERPSGKKYGWGAQSRDLGIKHSSGQYILHFNIDNILMPESLHEINLFSEINNSPDVIIFPIEYRGINSTFILQGIPPVVTNIDLIQAVAKKSAWDKIGGFKYSHSQADGFLIEELVEEFGYYYLNKILAVNR